MKTHHHPAMDASHHPMAVTLSTYLRGGCGPEEMVLSCSSCRSSCEVDTHTHIKHEKIESHIYISNHIYI